MLIQVILIGGVVSSMIGCAGTVRAGGPRSEKMVVITQADNDGIKSVLKELKRHQDKVRVSSIPADYLNCEAYEKLLGYGRKAVPYLIEQVATMEAAFAYIGSAIIDSDQVKTPAQVYRYNSRRTNRMNETLAFFILDEALKEIVFPEMTRRQRRRYTGYTEVFEWINWWQQHKDKFEFKTKNPVIIPPLRTNYPWGRIVKVTVRNGLIDVVAVGTTYRRIIERVAKKASVAVSFGKQEYLDVTTSVCMKSVTFEEFLYMLGRGVSIAGFQYRKTDTGYRIGK